MADTKISALPAGAPAQGTDIVPVARGTGNARLTLDDVKTLSIGAATNNHIAVGNGGTQLSYYPGLQWNQANTRLNLGVSGSSQGKLELNSLSNFRTQLAASDAASEVQDYTLPSAKPTANGQVLECSTAGTWSWKAVVGSGEAVLANTPTLITPNIGAATGTSLSATGAVTAGGFRANSAAITTDATTARTLTAADNGETLYFTNAAAITLTLAAGLGAGFSCMIIQGGTGQITVAAGGTTLRSYNSLVKTAGQYASATLFAPVADTFFLAGQLGS